MYYTTKLFGAPYGISGERGNNTVDPKSYAIACLNPGQRMDVFTPSDNDQTHAVRRFRDFGNGAIEVNID